MNKALWICTITAALTFSAAGQIITTVVRSGGASGIGYNGNTRPKFTAGGNMRDGIYAYSDQSYRWINTPEEMEGSEYVRTFDSDTNAPNVNYAVTFTVKASVWISMDDRVSSPQAAADRITNKIASPGTFKDTGWDLFIQEPAINRSMSVYAAVLDPGTYHFGYTDPNTVNNYVIGAIVLDNYGGGSGTAEDPYQLWTAAQFDSIRCHMNHWNKHFILMADIDTYALGGCGYYNVIGFDAGIYGARAFTGVFDGNGHTISGFSYFDLGGPIGMFGDVTGPNAQIKNLGLIRPFVSSQQQDIVAILVGSLEGGVVSNCFIMDGEVAGLSDVGMLVGINDAGTIVNCYATGKAASVNSRTGGLVGINNGILRSCYAAVEVSGKTELGGLIGFQDQKGRIVKTYWDTGVSRLTNMCGAAAWNATGCNNVYGKTTAEMKTLATFLTDPNDGTTGWDFTGEAANGTADVWRMCGKGKPNDPNDPQAGYPRLSWEYSRSGDFVCPDGVALDDLLYLANRWLATTPETIGASDANLDGKADLSDLAILSEHWLWDY